MAGEIQRCGWEVCCGICGRYDTSDERVGEEKTRRGVETLLRRLGWSCVKIDGWICPECAEYRRKQMSAEPQPAEIVEEGK